MSEIDPLIPEMVGDLLNLTPDELDNLKDDDVFPRRGHTLERPPEPAQTDLLKQLGLESSDKSMDRAELLKIWKELETFEPLRISPR